MWPIYNDHRQRNIAPTARSGRGDIALGLSAPESLIDDVAGLLLDGGQMVSITQGPVSYTHLTLPTNREV